MTGNIYFIQVGTDGPIKIGYTISNIRQRVRALQLISPHILRWIGFFPGTRADEKLAHQLLKNSSLRGEWFYPTVEVMAFIADKSLGFDPVIVENPLGYLSRPRSLEARQRMAQGQRERREYERKSREALNS